MTNLVAQAVQMQAASVAQSVGTAVARQQMTAEKSVADMVTQTAASASPPAPPGQGQIIDLKV